MNEARNRALTAIIGICVASLALWAVSCMVLQGLASSPLPAGMTHQQASAQVDSALQAFARGIEGGDAVLALSGFAREEAAWLEEQREIVRQVHARLDGRAIDMRNTLGYWIVHYGKPDSVSSSFYAGALVLRDGQTGQVLHEMPYYAHARTGRFQLHRPLSDSRSQLHYRGNLGWLYREIGQQERALEIWKEGLGNFPEAPANTRENLYRQIGELLAGSGDFAGSYDAYSQALSLLDAQEGVGYGGFEVAGEKVTVKRRDGYRFKMAECARQMGQAGRVRELCGELVDSDNDILAAAARRLVSEQ